jgi:ribonuclease BN (tRNA processing enzyme)
MRITILGTRGNIEASARGYSKHSGILVDGLILLDVGEREYLKYCPKYIFITHLHSDHVAIDAHDVPKRTVVYAPEASPRLPMIRRLSENVHLGCHTITPIPTVHSERVKSAAYLVEKDGERMLYSSDLVEIKPRFHHLLKNLDVVITEGSFIRSKGLIRKHAATGRPTGHNGLPDLVEFFSRFTDCIVVTHFGTWFYKDVAQSRQKIESLGNGVKVIPAHDGMQLETGSTIHDRFDQ